jgi:hypothetical protein
VPDEGPGVELEELVPLGVPLVTPPSVVEPDVKPPIVPVSPELPEDELEPSLLGLPPTEVEPVPLVPVLLKPEPVLLEPVPLGEPALGTIVPI